MTRLNDKGDWKKAREIAKQLKIRAKVAQDLEKDRVENYKKMKELVLDLYNSLPEYDCLFGDSPLSHTRLRFFLSSYAKKLGMDGVKGVFTPVPEIRDFVDVIDDATKWALKFENEKAS